jgi:phosphoribosylformylglycinamidine synthase
MWKKLLPKNGWEISMFNQRVEIIPLQKNQVLNPNNIVLKRIEKYLSQKLSAFFTGDFYQLQSLEKLKESILSEVFCDQNVNQINFNLPSLDSMDRLDVLAIGHLPGVTDNTGKTASEILSFFTEQQITVASGKLYFFKKNEINKSDLIKLGNEILANPLLHTIKIYSSPFTDRFNEANFPASHAHLGNETGVVKTYSLSENLHRWEKWSQENCWALSETDLKTVRDYFLTEESKNKRQKLGLSIDPTDVEIEIIAQTWSEHCQHRIFQSEISFKGEDQKIENIQSLYKTYIKGATKKVVEQEKIDWLVSVFSDNAGIVRFDQSIDLAIKVETHNSPSALDPYGGALTGILGVNRDIMGVGLGAKPIANTNVFCTGPLDWGLEKTGKDQKKLQFEIDHLPPQLKRPREILEGIHQGVEDGGNKSGIPTVNGAMVFDDHYLGKPLVYCGTVGVMPPYTASGKSSAQKQTKVGDLVIMAGGRIGKDGIHGATFSSLELSAGVPASVVQIGDPFTQKRLCDFTLKARDLELFTGITDNGAGGLSSSIGEMATLTGGASIDVGLAPTKYPGLLPYELVVSESQERMSFSVAKEKREQFLQLALEYNVEATVLGEFNNSGHFKIFYHQELVGALELDFLHQGSPTLKLQAQWQGPMKRSHFSHHLPELKPAPALKDFASVLLTMLARPNIASKESWVRSYDHEVQGATIGKPFVGPLQKGASDGGVIDLKMHGAQGSKGLTITCGLNPKLSRLDPQMMAMVAVDEAIRNGVALGANPQKMALVDNFCWPDPLPIPGKQNNDDAELKLGQLVLANRGLYESAVQYGLPFVSGKDSMKNDFKGVLKNGEMVKISVPPTLLITAIGLVDNVDQKISSEFKQAGDLIFYIGAGTKKLFGLGGSELAEQFLATSLDHEKLIPIDLKYNKSFYQKVYSEVKKKYFQSMHDVSDGGLIVCVAESCIGGSLGASLKVDLPLDHEWAFFYQEPTASFVVSIRPEFEKQFLNVFKDEVIYLGQVNSSPWLKVESSNCLLAEWSVASLTQAWSSFYAE